MATHKQRQPIAVVRGDVTVTADTIRLPDLTPAASTHMAELVDAVVSRGDAIVGAVQLRMLAELAPQPEARDLLRRIAAALTLAGAS